MAKLKLSNIVERDLYIDSDSFKSLSPKMKDAVKEIFESIKDNTDDIIKNFEGAVDKVAEKYNINTIYAFWLICKCSRQSYCYSFQL